MARGPSSFNLVTLLLLVMIGGGGYAVWKFFPVYWQAWEVDKALADGTTRAYYIAKIGNGFEKAQAKERLIAQLRATNDLRPRVERCEDEIVELKRRLP